MNIIRIRNSIMFLKNKKVSIKIKGSRNQNENIKGIVKEVYDHIFIVETDSIKRCFSYSDILIGRVIIKNKNMHII